MTRIIIDGVTENGGAPIYHRHFGTIERDNIGRIHLMYRRALGHATYFEGGIYGVYLDHNGLQRSAERVVVAAVAEHDISDPRLTLLPNGNMVLAWQEIPIISPGTVGTPIVFRAKLSKDNGATWSAPHTIFTCNYSYCRLFGQIKIVQPHGIDRHWRLALTAYYRVSLSPDVLHTSVFYSDDGGETWAEGTPIYSGIKQYNETAVAWAGTSIGIAVMRVSPTDGFYISRTLDGGTTWSVPAKLTTIGTLAVAPSLDVVIVDGDQYFLLGYCDRGCDTTKWRWESVARSLTTNAAFTGNLRTTSAADMIEASGYQTTKILPTGQMLFVEFQEYGYNTSMADPVGTDVRIVYANPRSWIAGEVQRSRRPRIAIPRQDPEPGALP